jgi:conjugal transfer/type IV secretion protein DotA/TraY
MAAPSFFSSSSSEDLAAEWLRLFSHEQTSMTALGPQAALIMTALKDALGIYGTAMLVVGGFLLVYQIVALIAETAQTGRPLGHNGRMLWTPLRFVLAFGLLVPIAGGLSSGQYLILKLAEQGSGLASNAWRTLAEPFQHMAAPQPMILPPDTNRLVYGTFEMEMCRALYRLHRQELKDQPSFRLLGPIDDFTKLAPQRLAPETWLYSNSMQPDLPLCGGYRFARQIKSLPTGTDQDNIQIINDRVEFSRVSAERMSLQARLLAEQVAPLFFKSGGSVKLATPPNLISLQNDARKSLSSQLKDFYPNDTAQLKSQLAQTVQHGWVSAAGVLPLLSASQWRYGQLTRLAVAGVMPPLFGHTALSADLVTQDILAQPILRDLPSTEISRLQSLYASMHQDMQQVRSWLYSSADDTAMLVPPDAMDVADLLARPGRSDNDMLAGIIDTVALSHNLWNPAPPNGTVFSDFWTTNLAQNPLLVIAAFGQSLSQAATNLLGLSGVLFSSPGLMAYGAIFFMASSLLLFFGLCLIFLLPFLPLLRFALGILTWLLTLLEALMAMPLMALTLLSTSGDGILSSAMRRACWLWLGLLCRPILILLGFAAGLPLLAMALFLINLLFQNVAADFLFQWGDGLTYVRLGLLCLYCLLVIGAFNLAFKGISLFPDLILRWFGNMVAVQLHNPALTASPLPVSSNHMIAAASTSAQTTSAVFEGQQTTSVKDRPTASAAESESRVAVVVPPTDSRATERPADLAVTMSAGHVSISAQTIAGQSDQILDDKGSLRTPSRFAPAPDYANLTHAIKDLAERLDKTAVPMTEPTDSQSAADTTEDATDPKPDPKSPRPQPPKKP